MQKPMLIAQKPILIALALLWLCVAEVSAPTTAFDANPELWPGFCDEMRAAQRSACMELFLPSDLNTSLRADAVLCGGPPDRLIRPTPRSFADCSPGLVPPVSPTNPAASTAATQVASLLSLISEHAKDLCMLVAGLILCCKFVANCVGRRKVAPPSPRSQCLRADL